MYICNEKCVCVYEFGIFVENNVIFTVIYQVLLAGIFILSFTTCVPVSYKFLMFLHPPSHFLYVLKFSPPCWSFVSKPRSLFFWILCLVAEKKVWFNLTFKGCCFCCCCCYFALKQATLFIGKDLMCVWRCVFILVWVRDSPHKNLSSIKTIKSALGEIHFHIHKFY